VQQDAQEHDLICDRQICIYCLRDEHSRHR